MVFSRLTEAMTVKWRKSSFFRIIDLESHEESEQVTYISYCTWPKVIAKEESYGLSSRHDGRISLSK